MAARELDIEKKLSSIPELRAQQAELVPKQAEIAAIIQQFESIQAQRELLPQEEQAYEVAQQAAATLAEVMAGLTRELDKPVTDPGVVGRMQEQALSENAKLDAAEQLQRRAEELIAQVQKEVDSFKAEVDAAAKQYAQAEQDYSKWDERREQLVADLGELINSLGHRLYVDTNPRTTEQLNRIKEELESAKKDTGAFSGERKRLKAVIESKALADLEKFLVSPGQTNSGESILRKEFGSRFEGQINKLKELDQQLKNIDRDSKQAEFSTALNLEKKKRGGAWSKYDCVEELMSQGRKAESKTDDRTRSEYWRNWLLSWTTERVRRYN
ncbi:MAG: hypothetical protein HY974_01315 [Candidatus Kerfeldbacteria bacterium]|nr:hypothetical protein [Candidatus Kerfeldbacteria bacterium]